MALARLNAHSQALALTTLLIARGAQGAAALAEAPPYEAPPASETVALTDIEPFCPDAAPAAWREAQTIEGVTIEASRLCAPDNPYAVAAFVKGTNNVSMATVMRAGLAMDAVTLENDRDGDGDPDDVHIRLEVVELNGNHPDTEVPSAGYFIAPGIQPGFWAFAPKTNGMAATDFESPLAGPLLRMPSPTIRVEQGDRVRLTLENTHYFPHSIHLHGVDHAYVQPDGDANDGVDHTSGPVTLPGRSFTYEIQPRQAGTMAYHCHVQTSTHVMMGLIGMFIVEENRPDNWVQTLNPGAGQVRHRSAAVRAEYEREYDLHYFTVDRELNDLVRSSNDPRILERRMHREYDVTDARADYSLVNGRSYPYTMRDALVVVAPDERIKLRVLNAGERPISLHTHGHKSTATAYDGVALAEANRITRDVHFVGPLQRVDLLLATVNDGLHSYGPGIWPYHDHSETAVTTNGLNPGGTMSDIVYEEWLGPDGMPRHAADISMYFSPAYWRGEVPVWQGLGDEPGTSAAPAGDAHHGP